MKWTDRMSSVIVVISFPSLLPHGITPSFSGYLNGIPCTHTAMRDARRRTYDDDYVINDGSFIYRQHVVEPIRWV